jgi:hypothetical protein
VAVVDEALELLLLAGSILSAAAKDMLFLARRMLGDWNDKALGFIKEGNNNKITLIEQDNTKKGGVD